MEACLVFLLQVLSKNSTLVPERVLSIFGTVTFFSQKSLDLWKNGHELYSAFQRRRFFMRSFLIAEIQQHVWRQGRLLLEITLIGLGWIVSELGHPGLSNYQNLVNPQSFKPTSTMRFWYILVFYTEIGRYTPNYSAGMVGHVYLALLLQGIRSPRLWQNLFKGMTILSTCTTKGQCTVETAVI